MPSLKDAATEDLASELLSRYREAIIIAIDPTASLTIAGRATPPSGIVDVHSKIIHDGRLTSTLRGVMERLLTRLPTTPRP